MGKVKKGKRANSDALHDKKSIKSTGSTNPFEVHVNKEKFSILGRKCKHDKGLPGVSRAKALKKRKATLGKEYTEQNKTNKFKDMRIGGLSSSDDAANARFIMEKMSQMKRNKKDLFNLDEEVLTHRGQTLEEIEQFRNNGSDESDEEGLDAEFTEAAHFGGGEGDRTDRKAAIEEIIAEAKKKKAEVAKEKDEVYNLTQKLDASYKSLIPLIGKLNKTDKNTKATQDDYDRAMREMIFEPRGEVTDKLISEEEIAKKEKERLEKLERERFARMRGEDEGDNQKPKHRSADDLDDGYFLGSDDEEQPTLAYNLNENSDIESNEEDEPEEMNEIATETNGLADELEKDDEESEVDDEEGEEESSEEDDNLSDLRMSDSESETELPREKRKLEETIGAGTSKRKKINEASSVENLKSKAAKELPYTYEMPENYQQFSKLLVKQHPDFQHVIIERMIKCNHPKVDGANKPKIIKLFVYLLQHLNDTFSEVDESNIKLAFRIFDRISPYFYDLINLNPGEISLKVLEVIKEKFDKFKKSSKEFPTMDTIILFKLISNIFSTSDFLHTVVTPAYLFISYILTRARVKSRRDTAIGLFLCTVILECTQLSKRFLPAVNNFLQGMVFLAINKRPIETIKITPPFQSNGPYSSILGLNEKHTDKSHTSERMMSSLDLVSDSIDEDFKVRTLNSTLKLISDLARNLSENVGAPYFAEPFLRLLERIEIDQYPNFVKENFENVKNTLKTFECQQMSRLVAAEKKPKALRLMEPRIMKVYDDKRRPKLTKEKEERVIMLHKIKRETKGAVREIRRDAAFISKIQIKKQLQSDLERKEKVRQIYAEASVQQGELNAMSRKKKNL